jgi:hypothetical protein
MSLIKSIFFPMDAEPLMWTETNSGKFSVLSHLAHSNKVGDV